jgi:hypothetical protein
MQLDTESSASTTHSEIQPPAQDALPAVADPASTSAKPRPRSILLMPVKPKEGWVKPPPPPSRQELRALRALYVEPPSPMEPGMISTSSLPQEVAVRVRSHGLNMDHVSTSCVEGTQNSYEMSSHPHKAIKNDEVRRFARVLDTVGHAFPGAVITQFTRPADKDDRSWRVEFDFSRTPQQAEMDGYVFNCSNNLYLCTRSDGILAERRQSGLMDQAMTSCGAMLARCGALTGDPVFGVAHRMLQGFWSDTPRGRRKQGLFVAQDMNVAQVDDIVGYGRAMLQDMLDSGDILDAVSPPPAVDAEDRVELDRLTWARAACRTALFLTEYDSFQFVGHRLFHDIKQTARMLGQMGLQLEEPVLLQGRDALMLTAGRILSSQEEKADPELVAARADMAMTELEAALRGSARILMEEAMIVVPKHELDRGDALGEDNDGYGQNTPVNATHIPGFSR